MIAEGGIADGLGNFENSLIARNLNLKNSKFKEAVILSGTIIEGEVETQGMICKNLIAHMA